MPGSPITKTCWQCRGTATTTLECSVCHGTGRVPQDYNPTSPSSERNHMIALEGGGSRMVTHAEYVEWVERCAREWNGKRHGGVHAALLRDKADRIRDPKNCPVCQWHAKEGNHGA